MPLPTPNLDDRRFQDLVDDAKRMVQRRCPEWTDHNVSDPGVTLIETFAFMVDQLLYRLNQLPDSIYVKFLELMGLELFPPSVARVPVTFWLTAPQEEDVVVEAGTEVATRRRRSEEPVVFRTVADLTIVRTSLDAVLTSSEGDDPIDQSDELERERPITIFRSPPEPGDTLLVGLDAAAPSCAVRLTVDCNIEGFGVDPNDPPLVWEALGATGWEPCDVEDSTGGFNEAGEVIVHLPASHALSVQEGRSAGWLRCRVVAHREDQPPFTASPLVRGLSAATIGGTASAINGLDVYDETVGVSTGVAGQRFGLRHTPVVAADFPLELEVSGADGWQSWTRVDDFATSGPDDRHWRLDAQESGVVFGPAVRDADGALRLHGSIPAAGAHVRIRRYRAGGGRHGNIAPHEIATLTTAIPFVGRVDNRYSAAGGVDAETLEQAKVRGPLVLGTRNRAVTAEDYEQLARESTPEVARVRCLPVDDEARPADDATGAAAGVRVLLVPSVAPDAQGRFRFEQLVPTDELMDRVRSHLDSRRMIGARIQLTPPRYLGVTVVLRLRARPNADIADVRDRAVAALYGYFDPLHGGRDGDGWPFGRPVLLGEVYSVVQRVEGVDLVEDARMFPADPMTGDRGGAVDRIDLEADSLVFSYGHQVQVIR